MRGEGKKLPQLVWSRRILKRTVVRKSFALVTLEEYLGNWRRTPGASVRVSGVHEEEHVEEQPETWSAEVVQKGRQQSYTGVLAGEEQRRQITSSFTVFAAIQGRIFQLSAGLGLVAGCKLVTVNLPPPPEYWVWRSESSYRPFTIFPMQIYILFLLYTYSS